MSYPTNYNPKGLSPQVIISDKDGIEQYRFEHDSIASTPIKNFDLAGWEIHAGINSDTGYAILTILDHSNKLLDDTKKRRPIKIKNSWIVQINLGKSADSLQSWFYGIIEEPALSRPGTNQQFITITAFGWGIRLAQRFASISKFQKKLSDGLTLDNTDETAKITNIVKQLLTTKDILVTGSNLESITVDNVDEIDIKLPDLVRNYQSVGIILNELAGMVGAVYGITPDRDFFFRLRGETFGGFRITNDVTNTTLITKNWDQDKILFTRNQNFKFSETTIGAGYTTLIGLGAQHETIDHDSITANASANLSSLHYAFPFVQTKDNISKVALFLSKNSVYQNRNPLNVKIVGALPDGSPDYSNPIQTDLIPGSRLEAELGAPIFLEIYFIRDVIRTSGQKLFLLISKYPDGTNYISMDYQTGSGTYYDSSDGVNWTQRTGQGKMRTYQSRTIHVIGQNTVIRKKSLPKETTFPLHDFPDEKSALVGFEGMLSSLGKTQRRYDSITVSAPDNRPEIGKTCNLYDSFNGLDSMVDLVGYDISGYVGDDSNLIAVSMSIFVEEWFN